MAATGGSRAALLWNRRLEAWRRQGGSSSLTRLLDRALLAIDRGVLAIDDEELRRVLGRGGPDESGAALGFALAVERDGERLVLDAREVRGIERDVRWVEDPTGAIGLVAGRPLRALAPPPYAIASCPALRLLRDGEERLLPFDHLALDRVARVGGG